MESRLDVDPKYAPSASAATMYWSSAILQTWGTTTVNSSGDQQPRWFANLRDVNVAYIATRRHAKQHADPRTITMDNACNRITDGGNHKANRRVSKKEDHRIHTNHRKHTDIAYET